MDLYRLSALNGCLGLYGGNMESNFWIMKQDEWKLLVKIGQIKPCVRSNKVLYCTKDGEVIFYKLVQHFYSNFGPSIQARSVTTFRPLANHLLEFEYHDQACLDSLSFPRLDPHAQD
ncbi:hypothetical protein H5410_042912 [Solanum commersonii]|uniref:Uncharacterized protein n=1 Tax=Solanum commersonii TaxID=4109 RepID=A0A9J5XZY4_SOLCO|nr:hypothetical protein H5410_042912 [Solanum commersonii]